MIKAYLLMHIKTKKRINKDGSATEYLHLVESYTSKYGKKKHKTIAYLGKKEDPKFQQKMEKLALKLASLTGLCSLEDLNDELSCVWSKNIGPKLVFRKLWNDLKFDLILDGKFHEHIFMMVLNRLCDPQSKLSCIKWKEGIYEPLWNNLKLHELYRALDWLMINKEKVELDIFNNVRDVFNQGLDLMLFDTTSVSYWGEAEECPELLRFGFSKDNRDDLKQLIVGLLMTGKGIPVAHEVYPGNQVDVKTFPQIISKVKDKFNLERVIWVCDRGMISENNIKLLEEIKHEYIIGVKMRMLNSAQKEVLLNRPFKEFKKIHNNLYVCEITINDKRYIVCYNPEQAEQDAINRAHFKRIVQDKVVHLTDKSWIMKNGYKKYIKLKEDIIEGVDYEKLEKEKIYDGKWVLVTNTKLKYPEIAKYYKSLWQIERAFRELKSSLDVKPMYHWTERRIRGHIFICFLALVLELGFRNKLGKASYSSVMKDLDRLQAVLTKIKDVEIIKTTKPVGTTEYAFESVQLQLPGITGYRPQSSL